MGSEAEPLVSALERLKTEEGFRSTLYTDTTGHATLGYGFNVSAGISQRVAAALLQAQLEELHETLAGYPWYSQCDPVRQSVLLDVAFNIGVTGLLHFSHMILAIGHRDWPQAKAQLLDSKAARELPSRYAALAQLLLTGERT